MKSERPEDAGARESEDEQLLETLRGIRQGLEQAKRGEGRPMRTVLEELARKRGISLEND